MNIDCFDKTKPGVIVLGGHVQGLGIIRIFGENGIPCILLDDTSINIARHSRYCLRFFKYPDEDLLNFLLDFSKKQQYRDWLLIPTNDYQVEILSKNKEVLGEYYKVSVADWNIVEKCHNKRLTYRLASDCKIDIPATFMPNSIKEIEDIEIIYPCIIKPAVMYKFYRIFKKKVLKCHNKSELINNYKKAIEIIPSNEIIIQEIIPGDSENQYSACFLYNGDESLVSLVARRKRQHPIDFGNATTFAETVYNDIIIEQAKKILNKVGYKGLCEVEFKHDSRDGKYKFLEINPRTWKWHYIAKASKSPFLMGLYNYIYWEKKMNKNNWPLVCWQHVLTDFAVKLQLLGKKNKKIVKNSRKPNIYAVFSFEDIKPYIFELVYLPILLIKR